jgi:hypothetical protein
LFTDFYSYTTNPSKKLNTNNTLSSQKKKPTTQFFFWNIKWFTLKKDLKLLIYIDFFLNFLISFIFLHIKNISLVDLKLKQQKNFYFQFNHFKLKNFLSFFLFGFVSFLKSFSNWFLSVLISIFFVYSMFFIKSLPFLKLFFQYFLVAMLFYLLVSGFVFFIKRYQYRLFTSVIQRFWRRSLIYFWLIEASLFVCFFYFTVNSNQEPIYMYDNVQFYKTHLFSWKLFLLKIFPLTLVIILIYFLLLSLKFFTFSKISFYSFLITSLILYISWSEFSQFYYILTYYGVVNWSYDTDEHLYVLDFELKRTRILNHYATICLIAKFWHIVFALVFWIFFILRGLEINRYRYPLLSANLQNFILIYIMSWMYMYPWFKFVFRKFLDTPYYWFFVNNRRLAFFIFFNDVKLFFYGFLNLFRFNQKFLNTFYYFL